MGVIGPEYEFLVADVGMNGRMSDGGNWSRNEFQKEKTHQMKTTHSVFQTRNLCQGEVNQSHMFVLEMMLFP